MEKIKREEARTTGALEELADYLSLPSIKRIESFDISNTSGFESVGSMVVYENGKPKRADYRKFKIKSIQGPDDYASMYEVLTRRFMHGQKEMEELKEKKLDESLGSFTRYPDLILMDFSLPKLDGWQATAAIKKVTPAVPIIALTAHAMGGDRERALAAGCDDYDTKPVDIARLLEKIHSLLAKRSV